MADNISKRDLWTTLLLSLLLLAGIASMALGIYLAATGEGFVVLGLGVLAVMLPASTAVLLHRLSGSGGSTGSPGQVQLLQSINDRLQMSELARRMVDRKQDREALRQAILDDMRRQDYEAALALVDEMAGQFGYVEEAEKYRQQIIDLRQRHREEMLHQALQRIRSICTLYDWNSANREVERLQRLFPEDSRVLSLPRYIQQAREDHKRELESEFLKAAESGQTDRAMELLKDLDTYLTATEAEAYLETARGVIGKARENFAVRFRMAVSDRSWVDALEIGEQIIREFPNTKMSNEVRDMMDVLRERAAGQRAAEAGRPY